MLEIYSHFQCQSHLIVTEFFHIVKVLQKLQNTPTKFIFYFEVESNVILVI